jgi:hypothetical protein
VTVSTLPRADVAQRTDPIGAVNSIVQWASDLSTAARAVELIVDTPFMPVSFWALPPGVAIRDFPSPWLKHPRESDQEYTRRRQITIASGAQAVVYGNEVGFTPQASLQSIYVVRGKPGMYAEAMSALVKSHGHDIVVEELTDRICRVRGRRKGEQDWQRFEFTIDRAKRAGYDKGNSKYTSDPQTMLLPRCLSIACRAIAPDSLKGLVAVEDITDEPDENAPKVTARTVQRAVRPQPEAPALVNTVLIREARASVALDGETQSLPELPHDSPAAAGPAARAPQQPEVAAEVGPAATSPEPDVDRTITDKQWRDINAAFVKLNVTGPGQSEKRLAVLSDITARPIARGSELSEADADLALSMLTAEESKQYVRDVLVGRMVAREDEAVAGLAADLQAEAEATYPGAIGRSYADDIKAAEADAYDPTVEPGFGES